MFLQCEFVQECWKFVLKKLNFFMPLPNTLWDLLESWPTLYTKSLLASIWICSPSLIIWSLWWERNKHIFRKSPSIVDIVNITIEKSISKLISTNIKKNSSHILFSNWDDATSKEWKYISLPTFLTFNRASRGIDRRKVARAHSY